MNTRKILEWRYATKRMNGIRVPDSKFQEIRESIRLSPSSIGLQPYHILTVTSAQAKEKIASLAYNQPQIIESSHLLIFTAWSRMTDQKAEEYIQLVQTERGVTRESLSTLEGYLENLKKLSDIEFFQWASKQVYLALGFALMTAASLEVDSTPMEGFQKEDLDSHLELTKKDLKSVVLLALGYRDPEKDWLMKMKKVRRSADVMFPEVL